MTDDKKLVKVLTVKTVKELEEVLKKYPGTAKVSGPIGHGLAVNVFKHGIGEYADVSLVLASNL